MQFLNAIFTMVKYSACASLSQTLEAGCNGSLGIGDVISMGLIEFSTKIDFVGLIELFKIFNALPL